MPPTGRWRKAETKANSDNVKDMNSAYFSAVEMIHASPSQSQQVTFVRNPVKIPIPIPIPIFNKSLFGPRMRDGR